MSPLNNFLQLSLETRQARSNAIIDAGYVPILVVPGSSTTSPLANFKFRAGRNSSFYKISREIMVRRIIVDSQAYFFFVGCGYMPKWTDNMMEIHRKYRATDGFLYLTYTTESTFG